MSVLIIDVQAFDRKNQFDWNDKKRKKGYIGGGDMEQLADGTIRTWIDMTDEN